MNYSYLMLGLIRNLLVSLLVGWSCTASSSDNSNGDSECQACHVVETKLWQESDHAMSMALPTDSSVKGDFSGVIASHFSKTARFYRDSNGFRIDLTEDGLKTSLQVAYTFGVYPLQQYLIEVEPGQYQVFPFAWDDRPLASGGQRWYASYDENILPNDRLHWLQPLQNWNGMCADCHSQGLERNFDTSRNKFDTSWNHINVACESCHGQFSEEHYTSDEIDRIQSSLLSKTAKMTPGSWHRDSNDRVARWQGRERKKELMDVCFNCHSLRSPVTDGFSSDSAFFDTFSPALIDNTMYYPDGQIKEEVYVYGSFLQSKMYQAGVFCQDCHDSHSMSLKVQGNGLCLQCHSPKIYQNTEHTLHDLSSSAGQCVNCHMPETVYMGVDARRDHSFVIPRPHLSKKFSVPNACTQCHEDKSNLWAAEKILALQGEPSPISTDQIAFMTLLKVGQLDKEEHLRVINSTELSVIKRASALGLLANSIREIEPRYFSQWIDSADPLIRLAAANVGALLAETHRSKVLSVLLSDKYKAIRVAAASILAGSQLTNMDVLHKAAEELAMANEINSWRGEGSFNQSLLYAKQGKLSDSIKLLNRSIKFDPYFDAAYVNLAETHRILGNSKLEREALKNGLLTNPGSAPINYSYGLLEIRTGNRLGAVDFFASAKALSPYNVQYAYLYYLALEGVGRTEDAVKNLKLDLHRYDYNEQLIQLGLKYSQINLDTQSFDYLQSLLKTKANRENTDGAFQQ